MRRTKNSTHIIRISTSVKIRFLSNPKFYHIQINIYNNMKIHILLCMITMTKVNVAKKLNDIEKIFKYSYFCHKRIPKHEANVNTCDFWKVAHILRYSHLTQARSKSSGSGSIRLDTFSSSYAAF